MITPDTSITHLNIQNLFRENPYNFTKRFQKIYPETWEKIKNTPDCKNGSEKIYKHFGTQSGNCQICGKKCFYRSFKIGYWPTCGNKCGLIKSSRDRFGVDNPFQSEEVKNKTKLTWKIKYGKDHPNKNFNQKQKIKNTKKIKYGNENYCNSEKCKRTSLVKYGVTNANKLQSVKDKITSSCMEKYGVKRFTNRNKAEKTCIEKYGCENVMQNAEFFSRNTKSAFKNKLYTFPSGKSISCQGYEPWAIDILLKSGINEENIVVEKNIQPEIFYVHNEKKSRYYPDIYVKKENKIVEVKSLWIYNKHLSRNLSKKEECQNQNYKFEFWIFDRNKNLTIL
jgi:hypothetical protein